MPIGLTSLHRVGRLLCLAVVACGRVGFDPLGGGGSTPDASVTSSQVAVRVVTDRATPGPNTPVANATVISISA